LSCVSVVILSLQTGGLGLLLAKYFQIFPLQALEKDKVLTLRKYIFENIYEHLAFFMLSGESINSLYSGSCCSLIYYLSNFCTWNSLCGSWETHSNNL